MKVEHQNTNGLIHKIEVPIGTWEDINMDFMEWLPRIQNQHDSIWVVVSMLTEFACFIPVKSTYVVDDARIIIDDIVCRHGIPLAIISDRGT